LPTDSPLSLPDALPISEPTAPSSAEPAPAPGAAPPTGITPDGKVILNQASAEELTKLPGVGPKRAQAIIALRTKLKRFKHPSERSEEHTSELQSLTNIV